MSKLKGEYRMMAWRTPSPQLRGEDGIPGLKYRVKLSLEEVESDRIWVDVTVKNRG